MVAANQVFFTVADLIDYEWQMVRDSHLAPEQKARRDEDLQLDSKLLQAGKSAALHGWLSKMRGPVGERFAQLRQLLLLLVMLVGALLGWATIRGLLLHPEHQPVNILPFLAVFVLLPLLFLCILLSKGLLLRWLGRLPQGWVTFSSHCLLKRVIRRDPNDGLAVELWYRLKTLHPQIFTLQAWILSQSFALAYYGAAAAALLLHVSVNDYVFAWQTTLKIGPELMTQVLGWVGAPFAWLGPSFIPDAELIHTTQYDRFSGRYLAAQGSSRSGAYWAFLMAVIITYGCLPRLLLLGLFQLRLSRSLWRLSFTDVASEELWLRLQRKNLNWAAQPGTLASPAHPAPPAALRPDSRPLVVVRWREAPFSDEELHRYFARQGLTVSAILDAQGREHELQTIPAALRDGQSLALVCDPWELPGEAFNRLRLCLREQLALRTAVFLVPLSAAPDGPRLLPSAKDRQIWQESLKGFRDPYVGLFQDEEKPL